MEYKGEFLNNSQDIAQNAAVSIALKVKDNLLHIMIVPVIVLQPTVPFNPMANLLHTLIKVPNALIIKQAWMLYSKLKAINIRLGLAEAHA